MDKVGIAIVDVESLKQPPDVGCSGSSKMTSLSRKGSMDVERCIDEELDADESLLVVKVENLRRSLVPFKTLHAVLPTPNNTVFQNLGEGRNKRLNRLRFIHPRKVLLFFAAIHLYGRDILILEEVLWSLGYSSRISTQYYPLMTNKEGCPSQTMKCKISNNLYKHVDLWTYGLLDVG
ncbi:uncharacterized protein LOC121974990 isoform X2 [Zingiber officinale]|uniref:uncharacterized protein LOC121974990 isoform X2 n=1 Tax=Zingiber officinale TaxID=94328 RepID=UPI001C4D9381|nr:uncharacterized protein LOC121974990 isoform X2 [Zingiber officinale]